MTYKLILYYLITIVPLITLDAIWLGLIAGRYYRKHLGYIFSDKFNYWVAGLFYLIYATGLVAFVVEPSLTDRPLRAWWEVAAYGAAFGLTAYAAYNLTNLATVRHWSIRMVIIDMIWGTCATAAVATFAVYLARTFII